MEIINKATGKMQTVWAYYHCDTCGYSCPAGGYDHHDSVRCPCKSGLLRRKYSSIEPRFPRTGYEGKPEAAPVVVEVTDFSPEMAAAGVTKQEQAAAPKIILPEGVDLSDASSLPLSPSGSATSSEEVTVILPGKSE